MTPARNVLFGHAVRLDALEESDVPAIARWQTGPFLRLYDARPAVPRSKAEVAEWLDDVRQSEWTSAFEELNLHRVTATVFAYNERSIALLEKLGFRREGAFREFLERDGRRYDMLLYGLLCHEWHLGTRDR